MPGQKTIVFCLIALSVMVSATHVVAKISDENNAVIDKNKPVREKNGDWIVSCDYKDNQKQCMVMQDHFNDDGQRILAIRITPQQAQAKVDILLSLGIVVEGGAYYKIGENNKPRKIRIYTCLADGCIASFTFGSEEIQALRQAKSFNIYTTMALDQETLKFNLPMNGFDRAYQRAEYRFQHEP